MDAALKSRKRWLGLFYGLAGGLGFSIMAWGIDALTLSDAHAGYPWLRFLVGLAICLPLAGLAGWATVRFDSVLLGVLLWTVVAASFAALVLYFPFRIAPHLMTSLDPTLDGWLVYPYAMVRGTLTWLSPLAALLVALAVASLENALIDQAVYSRQWGAVVLPLVGVMLLFGLAGFTADFVVNTPLRDPLVNVDSTLQFAVEHQNKALSPALMRSMHLNSVNGIHDMFSRPRDLFMGDFDRRGKPLSVLVNFRGKWVSCILEDGYPFLCKKVDTR